MRVVSFFSGAGGMDLGFIFAGHDIIWANDFDKDALETYNHNIGQYLGHNAVLGDITQILKGDKNVVNDVIPDCDIIIGGFPCQGFSIANVNRSMEDERNFLYLELLKAISVKQPPFFLLENVKGLENMEQGKILNIILDDLEAAGTPDCRIFKGRGPGYKAVYNVLNAYNYGVPQNRERVIILGVRNDIQNHSVLEHILPPENLIQIRKRLYVRATHSLESDIVDDISPYEKVNQLFDHWKQGKLDFGQDYFIGRKTIYKTTTLRDAIWDLPYDFDKNHEKFFNHDGTKCKVKISNRVGNRATEWGNMHQL